MTLSLHRHRKQQLVGEGRAETDHTLHPIANLGREEDTILVQVVDFTHCTRLDPLITEMRLSL